MPVWREVGGFALNLRTGLFVLSVPLVLLGMSCGRTSPDPHANDGILIEAVAPTAVPTRITAAPPPVSALAPQTPPTQTPVSSPTPAGPTPIATPLSVSADCLTARPDASPSPSTAPRISSPTNIPDPRLLAPTTMTEDPVLLDRLKALLGPDGDSTSFVVKNLQTNRGASFKAGQSYYPASLFKLFVMFEVFHQEALGILKPDAHLVMTPYYDDFGLSPRQTTLCQHLNVDTALDAMMTVSDNAAAVLLQDVVGSPNVNDSMAALGLTSTKLISEDLETSAADLALLLEGIARRQAVSPAASDEMIRLMSREQFDNGLRAGVPDSVMVAHKTGNYDGFTNDAGLVFAPNGTYLVVVLSEANDAQFVTRELSRTVYDYFTKGP